MLQSIFVYFFMALSMFALAKVPVKRTANGYVCLWSPSYKIRMIVLYIIFAFFSAVRYNVGIDHKIYISEYQSIIASGWTYREDMEAGFVSFMWLFAQAGAHYAFFFGALALVQIVTLYRAFRTERYILPYLGFLIMTGSIYFLLMNTMRQALVTTIFFAAVPLILKRKFLWYALVIAICYTFHKSAALLLPIYFVTYLKLNKLMVPRLWQLILLIAGLAVSQLNLWQELLQYTDSVFALIGYSERFSADNITDDGRIESFGARSIIFLLIDLTIIMLSPKLRETFTSKMFGFCYLFYIVYFTLFPVFVSSMAFTRVVNYFAVCRPIVSAYGLFYLFKSRKSITNTLIGCFILLLYTAYLLIGIYSDSLTHNDCVIYNFIWDPRF